jgi:tetratricopeptide (TPR) repeat protein
LRQQIGNVRQSPSLSRDTREAWRQKQNDRIARTPERQQALNDRLSEVDREDWKQQRQDNRESNREDWQQHRNGARDDWQNWYDDHYYPHYGWHNGCWHDGWHDHWDHMWHEHPLAVTFGLTCWGVNTMSYMFGTVSYSNPYYVEPSSGGGIDYSQPQIVVQEPTSDGSTAEAAEISEAGLAAFEQARSEFRAGNYDAARRQTDEVLKLMPHDAVVHEFRALTLFALKRYSDAAAVLHSVLAVGPGWDWTTMSQLYSSTEVYTGQLRALEAWTKDHASLPEGHLVLAYHYLTCGHNENATTELRLVVKTLPDDAVSARLMNQLTGEGSAASRDAEPSTPKVTSVSIKQESLIGKWTAKVKNSSFKLELSKDGRFSWSFTSKEGTQGISGVYALKDSTLAMEPDGGGVMLAELHLEGTRLNFQQVGADPGAAPLNFERD